MARKRGGLAGLYDRNKGLVRTAATIGAGLLGGPGAAAATGAAFRGLDRPGKSGIGLDPFAALRGGVEGYAIGQGTQGVKNLLTAGRGAAAVGAPSASVAGAPAGGAGGYQFGFQGLGAPIEGIPSAGFGGIGGVPDLPAVNMASKIGMTPGFGAAQAGAGTPSVGAMPDVLKKPGFLSKAAGFARGAGDFARENKDLIAMAGKGIMATQPAPGEEASMMNAETNRMRLEEEQRQAQMDEERKRRIAELLMPYIQQNYGSLFPRQG